MKRKAYITSTFTLATMALCVLMGSCKGSKKDADMASGEMPVEVALPQTDSVTVYQSFPGYISAIKEADVVVRVNGTVIAKHFQDGQKVAAGQPLFTIESTTYSDAVQRAQAALQSAIATNDYNTKEYEAMKRALESDAVSKMEVIQAESAMHASEAQIKTARAALQSAQTQLGYCTVRAPFAGRIEKASVVVGDYVAGEGQPAVVTRVFDDSKVFVNFSLDNDNYIALSANRNDSHLDFDNIPIELGDTIEGTFTGRLEYEAPDVDLSTGTVNLRLILDNPTGELKSGMYATVDMPMAFRPDAVMIADAAISTDQLGKFIYVVNDSDQIVYTPIKEGQLYHDTLRIVTSGITAKDRYVTQALLKVRNGMKVKPIMADK